jgi:hypothetical protein
MSVGPIPRSAIRDYVAEWGMSGDVSDEFHRIVRAMDSEYLTMMHAKKDHEALNTVSAKDREGVTQLMQRLQSRQNPKRKVRKH